MNGRKYKLIDCLVGTKKPEQPLKLRMPLFSRQKMAFLYVKSEGRLDLLHILK